VPFPFDFAQGRLSGKLQISPLRRAPAGGCDFLISVVVRHQKALQSIGQQAFTEVLRLRAIELLLCDSFAKRYAQDDGFCGESEKHPVGCQIHLLKLTLLGA
jgi:hypothetical protein